MRKVKTITFCLPFDLIDQLRENAYKEDRTLSNYTTQLLRKALKN